VAGACFVGGAIAVQAGGHRVARPNPRESRRRTERHPLRNVFPMDDDGHHSVGPKRIFGWPNSSRWAGGARHFGSPRARKSVRGHHAASRPIPTGLPGSPSTGVNRRDSYPSTSVPGHRCRCCDHPAQGGRGQVEGGVAQGYRAFAIDGDTSHVDDKRRDDETQVLRNYRDPHVTRRCFRGTEVSMVDSTRRGRSDAIQRHGRGVASTSGAGMANARSAQRQLACAYRSLARCLPNASLQGDLTCATVDWFRTI